MSKEHPYNCPCEYHTKSREYARELRRRHEAGEVIEKGRKNPGISGAPKKKRKDSRLVELIGPEGIIVHWMPKEETEWICPDCGKHFIRKNERWGMAG